MSNEWELRKIEDVAMVVSGGTPSRQVEEFWGGNINWATPTDITRDSRRTLKKTKEQITQKGLQGSSTKLLPAGTLLMTSRATLVEIKIAETDVCTNQGFKSLIPFDSVDPWFLFYQMKNHKVEYERYGIGTTFLEVNKSDTDRFTIPFPKEKTVQTKIANILTTLDNVIEKTEEAIAKYEAIKQGMMHDLFTRGIGEDGKLRPTYENAPELYKESELGWIPKAWDVKPLAKFLSMKSGDGITSRRITAIGDYPVYGGNGLRGYTKEFTHEGKYVLIGRQGALCGNIVLAEGKFYASEHAVVVTVLDQSDTMWVHHKLDSLNLNQYSESSAQPGLSVGKILKLKVSLPPPTEQKETSVRILSLEKKIQLEKATLAKQTQLKQGLMQDLLTGKVPVKADPINL